MSILIYQGTCKRLNFSVELENLSRRIAIVIVSITSVIVCKRQADLHFFPRLTKI